MIRIITGKYKGRKLYVPKSNTKPLTDRIKTSLFDILGPIVADSNILDLFSGSGGFGLEALSRGAKSSTFVDLGEEQINIIKANISKLKCNKQCTVVKKDVFLFLKENVNLYDIIMLDPPFPFTYEEKLEVLKLSINKLETSGILIFRYKQNENFRLNNGYKAKLLNVLEYGKSRVSFYQKI